MEWKHLFRQIGYHYPRILVVNVFNSKAMINNCFQWNGSERNSVQYMYHFQSIFLLNYSANKSP